MFLDKSSIFGAFLAIFWAGIATLAYAQDEAPERADLLTLAKGAVVVSASVDPASALALTDGDTESNWNSSTKRNPPPYEFVFELLAPAMLTQVGIDGAGERPGGVAGGSARSVLIEGSGDGPASGYVELARIEADPQGPTLADVTASTPIRWLRFTVEGGQKDDVSWIYLDEVLAYGSLTPPEDPDRFDGVFQTGRVNFIELKQNGASISGCYIENSGRTTGTISGAVIDGVALVNWTSDKDISGTAFLALDSTGALSGARYRDRSRKTWGGPVAPEGTTTPCSAAPPVNPIAQALIETGEVRIYGILFEYDSDVPKASSGAALRALRALLEALQSAPDMRVDIEGHTDADGKDAYNLDLSARRAASVVAWLVDAGIPAARLSPVGKGEAEPVASNATADGKALNRRVEVRRQ